MIEFNKEILNENYKSIWQECMLGGLTVPYLFKENTDRSYYPTVEDREKLSKKLTKKDYEKLSEAYYNRRIKERSLWSSVKGKNKRGELIQGYKENEVIEFLKKYPKYKNITL